MFEYKLYFDKKDKVYIAKTLDGVHKYKHYNPIEAIKGLDNSYKKKITEHLEHELFNFFGELNPLAVKCKIKYTNSLYVFVFVENINQVSSQLREYTHKLIKKLGEMKLNLLPSLDFCSKEELDLLNKINDVIQLLDNIDVKNYVLLSDLLDEQFLPLLNLKDRHKNL